MQADRPIDVASEGRSASGLRMPMLVSRVRETADHSGDRALAVDVVFNPWVLRCSSHEQRFRSQVRHYLMFCFFAFFCVFCVFLFLRFSRFSRFSFFSQPGETV